PAADATPAPEDRAEEGGEAARVVAEVHLDGPAAAARTPGARGRPELRLPVGTERVVAPPLLGIREHLVGLVDLLEARLRLGIALVHVGMMLAGGLAVRGLDLLLGRVLAHAEDPVLLLGLHRCLSRCVAPYHSRFPRPPPRRPWHRPT